MTAALYYIAAGLAILTAAGAVGDLWAHFFDWGGVNQ